MWILKGSFLGVWLFSFGTLAYLYFRIYRGLSGQVAVAANVITHFTTHNPLWWIAAVVCVALGLFITRSWSGSPFFWITLAVTEIIPVGLVAMFLTLVSRNNEAIQKMQNTK